MTPRRTSTRSCSTRCWRCRSTASVGDVTGSTSSATAKTIPATSRTRRIRTRGGTATGSSRPSIRMCPYDRFVKLQLAADLMPGTSRPDMRALGPIALGPQDHKDVRLSVDVVGTLQLNDWDERLDTVTPRPSRVVGCVRALPRSQVRSDPADGLRAADERVRVDVARAASVLRDRSEDRNALHVGVPADVRPALHRESARKRSRIEAGAGRAAGEEVPQRAHAAAGRDRRDVEGVPADRRVHQDRAVSGRATAGSANPDGTLKKREPVPDEKRTRPVDQIPNPERVPEPGRRRRTAQADRSQGAVPEFRFTTQACGGTRRSPISRSSMPRRASRAICRCIAAEISERRAIPRRAGSRSCSRKTPAISTTGRADSSSARKSSPTPRR